MSAVFERTGRQGPRVLRIVSRVVAAIVGGYALGALASVAALALPMSAPQGVVTGMLLSFVFYTAAVIWVFLARSATRAWVGLLIVAVPLALAAGWVASGAARSTQASASTHASSPVSTTTSTTTSTTQTKPHEGKAP